MSEQTGLISSSESTDGKPPAAPRPLPFGGLRPDVTSPSSRHEWFKKHRKSAQLETIRMVNNKTLGYLDKVANENLAPNRKKIKLCPYRPKKASFTGEPLLQENERRFTLDGSQRDPLFWQFYKKQQASMWTAEEIDMRDDFAQFQGLKPSEQHYIKHTLAFFAASDGIVAENLCENFITEIQQPAARCFLALQAHMENVHSETYANLIEAYVKDPAEQYSLFNAIRTIPSVQLKAEWALYWSNNKARTYQERIIAFAAVEGIFFSGSFCAIFWLKKRGLLPGLTFSNELISRDEGLHRDFAVALHHRLLHPASPMKIREIIKDATEIEERFVKEGLPVGLLGMNADLMTQYIRFVADHLLVSLGQPKLYQVENPFDWMTLISLQGKTNFFERKVGEYALSGVTEDDPTAHEFSLDADF